MIKQVVILWILTVLSSLFQVSAQTVEVFELKLGLQANNLPFTESIVLPAVAQNTPSSGQLNIAVNNTLSTDGKLLWTVTNNSGQDLQSLQAVTYIDIEIDQAQNTFFNETAKLSALILPDTLTTINGYSASSPVAWQIDEPGYRSGQLNQQYRSLSPASTQSTL